VGMPSRCACSTRFVGLWSWRGKRGDGRPAQAASA
jgi:hypothetical protein